MATDDRRTGDGRMKRMKVWLWILGAVIAALAVTLVVVLVTRDDDGDAPATTTTTSTTRATTTTTTTAPATTMPTTVPATVTTVALPVVTDDPQSYAQYLFAAWQNDDRNAAANVASTDAVNQIFAQAYPARGPYSFSGCNPAAGSLYCTWNGPSGASVQMQVRTLTGGLPIQVESVTFGS